MKHKNTEKIAHFGTAKMFYSGWPLLLETLLTPENQENKKFSWKTPGILFHQ